MDLIEEEPTTIDLKIEGINKWFKFLLNKSESIATLSSSLQIKKK